MVLFKMASYCLIFFERLWKILLSILLLDCYLDGKNVFQNCKCIAPYCTILPWIFNFLMAIMIFKLALAALPSAPLQQSLPCLLGQVLPSDVADLIIWLQPHPLQIRCHFLLANAALNLSAQAHMPRPFSGSQTFLEMAIWLDTRMDTHWQQRGWQCSDDEGSWLWCAPRSWLCSKASQV